MRRPVRWVVATVAVVLTLWPGTASAHAVLDSSTPAPSSVLDDPPAEIILEFNEPIEDALLSIRLFDSNQREIPVRDLSRDPDDTSRARAGLLKLGDGVFVVVWRAVSADGHPVSGAFPFQVGDNPTVNANELLTDVLNGLDTGSPLGTPLAVSRFLAYVGLVALIGIMVFTIGQHTMAPALLAAARRAVTAFAVGAAGILLLQGPYAAGRGWRAVFDGVLLADVLPTRLGVASLVRLLCAAGWAVLVITVSRAATGWWRTVFAAVSLASVVSFSVSGHPSAGSLPVVFVSLDAVHLVAVSVWVGAFFAAWLLRTEEGVARLSALATVAMPAAVATGAAQAIHLAGGISDVFGSRHGTFLLVKVLVIAACLAIGGRLRMRMKKGQPTVGRMLSVEAALLVVVIAVSALMVGSSPKAGATGGTAFNATQIQSGVVADFSVLPTRVGGAEVHVYLTPPGGSLSPVENVEMSFTLPSRGIPAVPVRLIEVGPNHWSGVMQFPYAGSWTLEARVQPTKNSTLLYTADVNVVD